MRERNSEVQDRRSQAAAFIDQLIERYGHGKDLLNISSEDAVALSDALAAMSTDEVELQWSLPGGSFRITAKPRRRETQR